MAEHSEEFLRKAAEARQRIVEIPPKEVLTAQQTGAVLIDVREREEYAAGHIEAASNVPQSELAQEVGRLIPDKQDRVVVYCNGGNRGAIAADLLQDLGYTNVCSIAGGFKQFKESGKG
jgi:phage shock protein E